MLQIDLGGGFKHFWFSPRSLGKWFNLTNIFQLGWNHQLEMFVKKTWGVSFCFDRFFVVSRPVFFSSHWVSFLFFGIFFLKNESFHATDLKPTGRPWGFVWLVGSRHPTNITKPSQWMDPRNQATASMKLQPSRHWQVRIGGMGGWVGRGVDEWWFVGFVFWIIYKKIVLVNYSYC